MSSKRVVAIMGVGPGIGRFAREGYGVALMARTLEKLQGVARDIRQAVPDASEPLCVPTDAKDATSVRQAFDTITKELGSPDVLVYNVAAFKYGGILDLSPSEFDDLWKTLCFGGFVAAQCVLPAMVERGSGTLIFTGASASLRGNANFSGLAVGKFGLRALSQSIAREFAPKGIHSIHVIIDGMVDLESTVKTQEGRPLDSFISSEAVAEEYWRLCNQNKTAWTQELDLRPYTEKF